MSVQKYTMVFDDKVKISYVGKRILPWPEAGGCNY